MSKIKRIFALALCFALTLTFLVSCGETEIEESKKYLATHRPPAEKEYVTLNLYIPCDFDATDKDGNYLEVAENVIESMQNEFNKVTEEKYRTRVIFKLVEEDKYSEAVKKQATFALENANTALTKKTEGTDKYPIMDNFQFDIFVSNGLQLIQDLSKIAVLNKETNKTENKSALMDLTQDLGVAPPGKTSYYINFCDQKNESTIPNVVYDNALLEGVRYGVPANFLIGDYKYTYVRIEDAEKLGFDPYDGSLDALRADIVAANAALLPGEAPYVEAEIIKNALAETDKPEDFYCITMEKPQVTVDDIFNGMFCVASTCRYKDRALEIINELYNNPALHTTLQYGSQDLTYKIEYVDVMDENGKTDNIPVIIAKDNAPTYVINPRYTGNICNIYVSDTIALPGEYGETIIISQAYIDKVCRQNNDAEYKG